MYPPEEIPETDTPLSSMQSEGNAGSAAAAADNPECETTRASSAPRTNLSSVIILLAIRLVGATSDKANSGGAPHHSGHVDWHTAHSVVISSAGGISVAFYRHGELKGALMSENVIAPNATPAAGQPVPSATTAGGISLDAKRMMQYDANKKSMLVAYLLWGFLGWFGAHRFYLGRTGTGLAILLMSLVGFATSWFGVGLVILLIPLLWLLVDVFLVPGMVQEKNNQLVQMLS